MAKISLAIDKNYCASWGVFEGIREFLQNAKDAEDDGYSMTIEHFPRTSRLEITTRGIYIDPSKLLILGRSDKTPGERRGQFGEGFVLGTLALVRKGHDVKFVNGDLSWNVSFERPDAGHPFQHNELLTFKSRKISVQEPDFKLEIESITTDIWAAIKKLFLFLEPPKPNEMFEMSAGRLLIHPDRKGQVFARGIFVRLFEDLVCGYDMHRLELDRDRRMVDEFHLHYNLGQLWQEACGKHPDLAAPKVYEMAKANSAEVRQLKYHADAKLLKHVRDRFEAEHGEHAAPVTTMTHARAAESAGVTPIVVSDTLRELLEKGGLSAEAKAEQLSGTVKQRFSPTELTAEALHAVARLEAFLPKMVIVAFHGDDAKCRLIDDKKVVGVDHRLLVGPFKKLLNAALHSESQRRGIPVLDILLEHLDPPPPPAATNELAKLDTCDECGAQYPQDAGSHEGLWHSNACSLYPHEDAKAETPTF
jgi:hypothetical protein